MALRAAAPSRRARPPLRAPSRLPAARLAQRAIALFTWSRSEERRVGEAGVEWSSGVGSSDLRVAARVGVVEARVALEHGLAARLARAREGDGQHGVAGGGALAQGPAAAARALEVAGGEARAEGDRAVHLV